MENENQNPVAQAEPTQPEVTLDELQGNYNQLKSENEVLKAQAEAERLRYEEERFATPLVKRIDEMSREGATPQQIVKFAALQTLELDKMSSEEMIKQKLALEKPGFSAKEIDRMFTRDFPALDGDADDDERDLRELNLKEKALEARKYLEDQLATAQDSKAMEAKAKREAEYQAQTQRYETVTASLMKQVEKLSYNLDTNEFKYNFDFPVQHDPEIDKHIVSTVVSEAMKNNIPASDNERIKAMVNKAFFIVYGEQMMEAMVRDNWAASNKRKVVENSNNMPLPSGSGAPKNPPPPKTERGPVMIKGSKFV